jgi:hypothetical protein
MNHRDELDDPVHSTARRTSQALDPSVAVSRKTPGSGVTICVGGLAITVTMLEDLPTTHGLGRTLLIEALARSKHPADVASQRPARRLNYYKSNYSPSVLWSTRMPGPMVVEIATFLRY